MIAYEQLLDRDVRWALQEGSMYFEKESAVHKALRKISRRLNELGIPYAVVGGLGMFLHGYRRFTEDVDIVVSPAGLKKVHQDLEGLGYIPLFSGSKNLRDTETGVRIEFLVAGGYPGDGKPKPVAFPDPKDSSVVIDGISVVQFPRLIDLKLASGMTNPGRLDDLGDVVRMIRALDLPENLADQLNPYVQGKYRELWASVRNNPLEP